MQEGQYRTVVKVMGTGARLSGQESCFRHLLVCNLGNLS